MHAVLFLKYYNVSIMHYYNRWRQIYIRCSLSIQKYFNEIIYVVNKNKNKT